MKHFVVSLSLCISAWRRYVSRPWWMRCRSWRRCPKTLEPWCMERGEDYFSSIHNKTENAKRAHQQESPPSVNDPAGCSPSSCVSPRPLAGDKSGSLCFIRSVERAPWRDSCGSQPFLVLLQFDGEGPASEERVQEEHRQSLPIRVHAAEPPPYVSDTHVHRHAHAGGHRHVHTLSTTQTLQTDSCRITDSHTPHHSHLQHRNACSRSHSGGHGWTAAESHRYTNLKSFKWGRLFSTTADNSYGNASVMSL